VTGAGRGIGRAITLALAARGARTALVSRTPAELEAVAAEVAATGAERPPVIVADMNEPAQIAAAARRAVAELGPVDVLVNNAAVVWPLGPTAEVDPTDWEAAFRINVFAVLRMTQEVLPSMLERGWGRIVDVSSGIVTHPGAMVGGNAYGATKAALHERFVTGYESGSLLTPEDSASALLDHLDAGGSGQIWDVP
jgi:NAD(P)-dependent dehydrogenase (short-subunit alcohol dehydrogenase family)